MNWFASFLLKGVITVVIITVVAEIIGMFIKDYDADDSADKK